MKVKMILPALIEAKSPYWRPIKYSLFPPLGLATLAAYLSPEDQVEIVDEHVETLDCNDQPDLVVIQVYITNAYRAYQIADEYRKKGCYVCLGGVHVTALPSEAVDHADTIFLGPGEKIFPDFLNDFRMKSARRLYFSSERYLGDLPPVRRDLIQREKYLVPNSVVVTRGCPHHCDFCYKDDFFKGGKSYYRQPVELALSEIERLPGRHLYFLDDHLLGHQRFSESLFDGLKGMGRVWQAASTVDAVLRGDLIEKAAEAGLRSLFIGFESLSENNLRGTNKSQNLEVNYQRLTDRLHDLGIMINGSFVFGLDDDDPDVFKRTVDWTVNQGITTATFHILTPYPGTALFRKMENQNRIVHKQWDLYDTRHVVYRPKKLTADELKQGYDEAYDTFYQWRNIFKAANQHPLIKHKIKHMAYSAGWKKLEPLWNFVIKHQALNQALPFLEAVLSRIKPQSVKSKGIEEAIHVETRL